MGYLMIQMFDILAELYCRFMLVDHVSLYQVG